jgi:hypothetical protein
LTFFLAKPKEIRKLVTAAFGQGKCIRVYNPKENLTTVQEMSSFGKQKALLT